MLLILLLVLFLQFSSSLLDLPVSVSFIVCPFYLMEGRPELKQKEKEVSL